MASVQDYTIDNASGSVVRGDINAVFAAIVTNYSSNGVNPPTMLAYQFWADTNDSQLKLRNSNNDDWVVLSGLDGTNLLNNGTAAAPSLTFTSDVDTGLFRAAADELAFATAGTERVRINDVGWVGVNADPEARFHVDGEGLFRKSTAAAAIKVETNITSSTGSEVVFRKSRGTTASPTTVIDEDIIGEIKFQGYTGSTYEDGYEIRGTAVTQDGGTGLESRLSFLRGGAERFRLGNDGVLSCLGVYTETVASGDSVSVSSTGVLARITSSIKYKTSVETLEDSYADALLGCRPVWYRSTCEGDNADHSFWGFIAEEVADIDPRLVNFKTIEVTHDAEGRTVETPCTPEAESVMYDRFVPHLLNLVKRQKAAIEALEARVTALEGA